MNAILAKVFPPGEFLKDELEARGWSQTELAEVMDRPVRLINEIVAGKKSITPETAVQLGDALGTGPELWLNLESQYQLSKVPRTDKDVARRAQLYAEFQVREMTKRGWIRNTDNLDELEQELVTYFGIKSLTDDIRFCHAPKKTQSDRVPSKLQLAWLFRARDVASTITPSGTYSTGKLEVTLSGLKDLRQRPEDVRKVAALLSQCGIRFVVVEPIPRAKIDGACFWITNDEPVVAMSLRLDRIDNFWFVLRHELEHVLRGHGKENGYILETDLEGVSSDVYEQVANEAAAEFCVPQQALSTFVTQLGTHISNERLLAFARELEVHPGLVAGQVQRRLERFDLFRKLQVKVRNLVIASARTDGYGTVAVDPIPISRHETHISYHQSSNGSTP